MALPGVNIVNLFGESSLRAGVVDVPGYGGYAIATFMQGDTIRLDVSRNDLTGGMDWDELMAVKDAAGYGDKDAYELFPANDAVMNTANIRHLYIFDHRLELVRR